MLDALDITEEEAAGLSELAALDLATARRFSERAMAVEDPDVGNGLARTAQRAARSYRQTLALKVRLRRELSEQAREYPRKRNTAAIARRKTDVRVAVTRVAWAEREAYEGPEDEREEFFDDLMDGLAVYLSARAAQETFEQSPLDEEVVALCADLGLPEARARGWRDLPDPPAEASDEPFDGDDALDPGWRASG
ncbi:hypothetical protein [Phenylobacterium sp.]|uniref:hypothetical protein n=1 Tax=Phenylobacterium sp. TaxID=1871053 RepID=UPI0025E051CF|nr:hypothetical protein [Phenylobacterium sp.]